MSLALPFRTGLPPSVMAWFDAAGSKFQRLEVRTRYPLAVEIAESARPHGIADDDIAHAIRQPIRWIEQAERRALVIGADDSGRLLEVVVLDPGSEPVVVHVQVLRPAFYDQL